MLIGSSIVALAYAPNNEKVSGRWYALYSSQQDPAYAFLTVFIYANMNERTMYGGLRIRDFMACGCATGSMFMSALVAGIESTRKYVLAVLIAIGGLVFIKAKVVLIKNISHLELKKHMLTMTWIVLSQLHPILYLAAEYYGCTLRAEAQSPHFDLTTQHHLVFSTLSLDNGEFCGR